jgi:voltage-gated sodium channel
MMCEEDPNPVKMNFGQSTPDETHSIFIDVEGIKSMIRDSLAKPEYNVSDFYFTDGFYRMIATHPVFENTTLLVISINAIWISVDTDNNNSVTLFEAEPVFQLAEQFFCIYFAFEWFIRYMSFERKRDGLKDAWFVFDSALVFMMVVETWVMNVVFAIIGGSGGGALGNAAILRLLRLLRLSRLARMLRSMPELMILIKGMVAATRSLFFTMCLLLILIYVYAIAFTQLTDNTPVGTKYFATIPMSMYTLLLHGTLLDNLGPVCKDIGSKNGGGPHFLIIFSSFICASALMVMNMLIGVLCEVVSAVASTEQEEMAVCFVKEKMYVVVQSLDTDGDMCIAKDEFREILRSRSALNALEEVGVDPVGLVDFADFIFDDGNGNEIDLSFEDFMTVVMDMRSSQQATVKDMRALQQIVRTEMKKVEARVRECNAGPPTRFPSQQHGSISGGRYGQSSEDVGEEASSPAPRSVALSPDTAKATKADKVGPTSTGDGDGAKSKEVLRHTGSSDSDSRSTASADPEGGSYGSTPAGTGNGSGSTSRELPRTEPVEALLMAAHGELSRMLMCEPLSENSGSFQAQGGGDAAWRDAAAKLGAQLAEGLRELEDIQRGAQQTLSSRHS